MTDYISELLEDYGKKVARATQQFSPEEYPRTARKLDWAFRKHLPASRNARILDVGCGAGHFLYYLVKKGYVNAEGVDSSEDRLALCRHYVTRSVHKTDAIPWLASHRGVFDVVVSNHVIEHIRDEFLHGFLRALTEAVAPGGTLILTTPNACTPWAGYNRFGDLTHCRLFSANSLAQLLAMLDWEAEFFPDGPAPYDAVSAVRWILWKAREAALKASFFIDVGGMRGNQTTPLIVSHNLLAVCRRKPTLR
jgi:2-polyprenyl-3-methyl-5-hydroxy-6-metoxy-1,4-benzoquinol methylase